MTLWRCVLGLAPQAGMMDALGVKNEHILVALDYKSARRRAGILPAATVDYRLTQSLFLAPYSALTFLRTTSRLSSLLYPCCTADFRSDFRSAKRPKQLDASNHLSPSRLKVGGTAGENACATSGPDDVARHPHPRFWLAPRRP